MITDRPAVLDACVLLNLLATERIAEVAKVIAPACLVCSAVAAESLYLRPLEPGGKPEAIDLGPLVKGGVLTACAIQGPLEEEAYVNYAIELDDGEAMSLAIAQARNFALATDERKARRIIRENLPHLLVISTAEIVHGWARTTGRADAVRAVRSIETRARFRPPDTDPLSPWWSSLR